MTMIYRNGRLSCGRNDKGDNEAVDFCDGEAVYSSAYVYYRHDSLWMRNV